MNTVQRESLGHLNAQGVGPMGWYLQGQDPSGRVGGGLEGGGVASQRPQRKDVRGGGTTQGGQTCVIMPGAGQCRGDEGSGLSNPFFL